MTGRLLCEGVSISGIARILKIAINTVLNQIRKAARLLLKPPISLQQEVLEVDELHTYIKSKKMNFG